MYIILKEETWNNHEGTVVRRVNLDSRDYREGFATHVFRNAEQIAEAVEHMSQYMKSSVLEDMR